MRGTLLNTATVAGGSLVGLAIGRWIPASYEATVLGGFGLVTIGIGLRLFLQSKNILVIAAAVGLGGIFGLMMGLEAGFNSLAEWARHIFGGAGRFTEGLVTTSVLYCVGPMTLMGCIQDGLEGRSELLQVKSVMDGISAIFFAAAMGPGVLLTAFVVLVVQGTFTLLARPMRRLAEDESLMQEASAAGGILMMGLGLGLLDVKKIGVANFLPALFLAPAFVLLGRKFNRANSIAE